MHLVEPELTHCGQELIFLQEIFDNPQFFVNGPTASDVRQGYDGDCWLMAALCTMGNKEELIEKICVARNEDVGIYGFVFHRGEQLLLPCEQLDINHVRWRVATVYGG